MLTTDTARSATTGSLVAAAAASLVVGAAVSGLGAVIDGSTAAYGALLGTGLAVSVFALGGIVVDVVSRRMPSLSLLVALLTYTLQVVAMAAAFAALDGSSVLRSSADRQWLGAAVVVGVLAWLVVQIPLIVRRRVPTYQLHQEGDE